MAALYGIHGYDIHGMEKFLPPERHDELISMYDVYFINTNLKKVYVKATGKWFSFVTRWKDRWECPAPPACYVRHWQTDHSRVNPVFWNCYELPGTKSIYTGLLVA